MKRADLASAALRHIRDAERLAVAGPDQSLDQALHLAGFGPECIRKACLDVRLFDKALGHEMNNDTDVIIDFLAAYDPDAVRYRIDADGAALPLRARYWRVEIRYVKTGHVTRMHPNGEAELHALLREARSFVDERMCALYCDGVLGKEAIT